LISSRCRRNRHYETAATALFSPLEGDAKHCDREEDEAPLEERSSRCVVKANGDEIPRKHIKQLVEALVAVGHKEARVGESVRAAWSMLAAFGPEGVGGEPRSDGEGAQPPKAVLHGSERKGLFVRREPC
jgi:hypothetical protein